MEEAQHPPTSPEITTSAPVPEAPSSLQTENGTMDSLSVSRVAGGGNSSSALPRNLSTASLSQTPEACHVEDIDQGCSHVESHHKNSVLHSAVPTPVASRSPSRIALHNMAENQGVLPQMKEGMGEGAGSTRGEPMEAEEEEKGLEMKVEPKVNLDSENNVPSNASSQVENPYIAHSPAPVDHPVPAEDPKPVIAESRPVYPAPETAPSEGSVDSEEDQPIENQQVPDPASEADINWGFDDIAALQSHVNGTDSFELLKQRAPERSSSFPQAGSEEQHQTPGSDDTEQALFNMMASEVATGNGDRGMFDTPSVEQGGLFDSNGVAGAEESFFDGFSGNGAGNPTVSMGQVTDNGITTAGPGLDAEENMEKEASRYEEGLPLINNDDEAKEDTDLFGDVKTDDDFFGGLSSGGPDTGDRGISGLQRKSTIQVIDGAKGSTHPYHSGEGVAASLSAVMSEVVESTNNTPPAKDPIASLFGGSEENSGQPDGEDFFGQIQQQEKPEQVPKQESADDLTAQWQAALAGDEFLADDSEGFLPSDDEGFLPDSDDETPVQRPVHGPDGTLQGFSNISTGNIPQAPSAASRYTPQAQIPTQPSVQPQYGGTWPAPQPQQAPYNPYAPPQQAFQAPASQMPGPPPAAPYSAFGGRPPPAPEMKAQSFVDKKEGYQSPYDLPLDIGPPAIRKRPSNLQQLQSAIPAGMGSMVSPPPPVRSSSMGAFFSAEAPTQAQQPQGPPKPKVIPQQKFFEELPIGPPKQRATSALGRHPESMNRAPSGAGGYQVPPPRPESTQGFYQSPKKTFAQPVMGSPQQMSAQLVPQTTTAASRYSPAPRATSGMYAAPPAPAASVRYSPAPSTTMGYQPPPATIHPPVPSAAPYASPVSAPPAGGMKYAPRPAGPPQVGNRVPSGGFATPPQQAPPPQQPFMSPPSMTPQNLPHQHSFTASPPFHHPHSPEDPHHSHPRRFSGEHHAMHSSRPGTARSVQVSAMDIPREEEEEGATNSPQMFQNNGYPSQSPQSGVPPPTQSRYAPSRGSGRDSPASLPSVTRQNTFTPPPPSIQSPRYIPNALPQRTISPETTFQPPPRAQTQSPGMAFGKANKITQRPRDPYERPSSAFAHSSSASYASIDFHQRQQSLGLNFIAPNDEAGQDVLQRWQGAPVFCWGFGGSIAYTFPKRAQRYTSDMQQPMIKCSPGEVKVRSIKEILPFEESEGKFPGPAWSGSKSANKAKKKELLTWFTDKIEDLERRAQGEGTRAEEKVLLWKIVRVLLENDGVLEGSPEVEKATRAILSPETVEEGMGDHGSFVVMGDMSSATQGPNIERADPQAVNTIKNNLLKGDRAAAVWHAVDRKLWSHALLISGTVCRDLWKQVVQEFVKNEVKTLGEGADSLAALYETFAGNWEECVDELVSASARMGMPMLGGASRSGSVNIDEKLDRWRETLGLILSNRSPGDAESIMALGKMLVGYGRVEAGHICYLFARQGALGSTGSVFSGHDDPAADFSLLGADHRQATFGRDADSVMLSEVYELAVSLCATPSPGFPHLQSYKLQCAIVLAENGQKGEAQKYCDSIASSIKAWNKPSPYFHPGFFGGLEDLSTRLSMSPKDSSPSGTGAAGKWIPKLSSDTVSNSLWGTFNKFVAGEEEETSSTTGGEGGMMDAVAGPFAKVAGPGNVSPDISRVQSGVDLYSAYNNAPSYNGTPPMAIKPASQAANRYAPSNSYQPKSSLYEPAVNQRATSDTYKPIGYGGGYEPSSNPYAPQQQTVNPYDSPVPSSISTGYPGASTYDSRSSFEDTSSTTKPETMETSVSEPPPSSGGYQPPSAGGYEPPSTEFTPYEPENNDDENEDDKPKPKKSFMDDDDDDFAKKAEQARKLQQEEAKKKAEEEKKNSGQDEGKKGWFGGWFGKKDPNQQGPIKAKLGEESSFVYDPDLKRWVNKKAGDTAAAPPKPAPPPKRASTPTSQPSSTPSTPGFPPSGTSSAPPTSGLHAPPPPFGRSPIPSSVPSTSTPPPPSGPPASAPPSAGPPGAGPPSRPPTSISQRAPTGDTIDDLLGPPGAPVSRKSTPGGGKKRGKSRYVEVIPGQS